MNSQLLESFVFISHYALNDLRSVELLNLDKREMKLKFFPKIIVLTKVTN